MADDRSRRKRTKIAAVERVAGLPVQKKYFALRDRAAALPIGQWPFTAIALAGRGHLDAVDQDGEADAANSLPGKGGHFLKAAPHAADSCAARETSRWAQVA